MQCKKCGAVIEYDENFCAECGTPVVKNNSDSVQNYSTSYTSTNGNLPDYIVDPTECIVAKIGGNIPINLLTSSTVTSWAASVTNKRVYFRGRTYTGSIRQPIITVDSKVVDLEDITGSGFIFTQISIFALIIDIILILFGIVLCGFGADAGSVGSVVAYVGVAIIIAAIVGIIRIFLSRKTFFSVEYAGGIIFVDAKLFPLQNIDDFNKQIRRAKDRLKGINV